MALEGEASRQRNDRVADGPPVPDRPDDARKQQRSRGGHEELAVMTRMHQGDDDPGHFIGQAADYGTGPRQA